MTKAQDLGVLIRDVRRCFQALKIAADHELQSLGINASMRAILELLADGELRTVPQIARLKTVSRQHVQLIVDALIERGLAEAIPNPGHARSDLIRPTRRGGATISAVKAREAPIIEAFAQHFSAAELQAAAKTVSTLTRLCTSHADNPTDRS